MQSKINLYSSFWLIGFLKLTLLFFESKYNYLISPFAFFPGTPPHIVPPPHPALLSCMHSQLKIIDNTRGDNELKQVNPSEMIYISYKGQT